MKIRITLIKISTFVPSDHGTPRNQNKLKILRLIFIPSVRDSSRIAMEIVKFDRKKEKRLSQKYSALIEATALEPVCKQAVLRT